LRGIYEGWEKDGGKRGKGRGDSEREGDQVDMGCIEVYAGWSAVVRAGINKIRSVIIGRARREAPKLGAPLDLGLVQPMERPPVVDVGCTWIRG
jgi:hypothetical protein